MKLRSGKTLDVDNTLTESVNTHVFPITLHVPSPDIVPIQLTAFPPIPPTPSPIKPCGKMCYLL